MPNKTNEENFIRKDDYSDDTIKDVRALIKAGKGLKKYILAIPGTDGIICYYGGLPFVTINDSGWNKFSTDYDDYFTNREILNKIHSNYKKFLLDSGDKYKNLSDVLDAINKGQPRDHERHTQQEIACNNLSFSKDKYSICGFETAFPKKYIPTISTKPEVDLVAFCPDEKRMILIEFKCRYSALDGKHGIKEHFTDYKGIVELKKNNVDRYKCFINAMLKAYYLMSKLYNEKDIHQEINSDDIVVDIAFLLTGSTIRQNGGKGCISVTVNSNRKVLFQKEKGLKGFNKGVYWYWEKDFNDVIFTTAKFEKLVYQIK